MLSLLALVAASPKLTKDADGTRFDATDGRRDRDDRNRLGLRLGEQGAGDPGCTSETQAVIAAIVAERQPNERSGLTGI